MDIGRRDRYLSAMGVPLIRTRTGAPVGAVPPLPEADHPGDMNAPVETPRVTAGIDLDALRVEVANCTKCGLHASRNKTVFGVGPTAGASVMVIGEAPGADEDRRGEPFVGRAGKLLDAMLHAAGLPRETVYIANILKCRPPRNRDPAADEVAHCIGYLHAQIEALDPAVLVAVGRIAAQNLLGTSAAMKDLRGRPHEYRGRPLLVTYHPAYLLRSPQAKGIAWQDLKQVMRIVAAAR